MTQSKVQPNCCQSPTGSSACTELSEIDASIRSASLLFVIAAISWLLIGTAFSLVTATQAQQPSFMAGCEFTTFGRMHSAQLNVMAFGWGSNVIFAVGLWIMARLCRAPIRNGGLLLVAGLFWNFGLTAGIAGIIAGDITAFEWLDLPGYATPILAVSYALIGIWGIMAFRFRQSGHVYVAQLYILAALFWFPWFYVAAQFMVVWFPARGVVQAIVHAWFSHNMIALWLTPMALATAYYIIPKVVGRSIYSYSLAAVGFWSLALFSAWGGMQQLVGGPVPAWLISTGTVASVMMVFPVIAIAITFHKTIAGNFAAVWRSPALRFIVFGVMSFVLSNLVGAAMSFRSVGELTQFTQFTSAHTEHSLYAFFSMILFGGVYYMVPRLLKREWPSASLIKLHFWGSAAGITAILFTLYLLGWTQGTALNDAAIPFLDVVHSTLPWLQARLVFTLLLAVGHLAFAVNFFWMLFAMGAVRAKQSPTLLSPTSKEGAA